MMASETERAMAVVNMIWDAHPQATLNMIRDWDGVAVWVNDPDGDDVILLEGKGPTYVAALLDLGAKLPEQEQAE